MPTGPETLFITLGHVDHRRLVLGQMVFHQIGETRLGIRLDRIPIRELFADILEAMGDDPPEAREFLPHRNHRRKGTPP
jgi:hypothetical protein